MTSSSPLDNNGTDKPWQSTEDQIADLIRRQTSWPLALVAVAQLTADSIPGADGAGIALMNGQSVERRAASSTFASDVDTIQYEIGEGPCLTAVAEARTTTTGRLGQGESRWPQFDARSRHLDLHSVLSLPLVVRRWVPGSLNVYARAASAFDSVAVSRGEELARPAAVAVQNARALHSASEFASRLESAMHDQAVLTVAIALLQETRGLEVFAALAYLEQRATTRGQSITAAAAAVVADPTEEHDR